LTTHFLVSQILSVVSRCADINGGEDFLINASKRKGNYPMSKLRNETNEKLSKQGNADEYIFRVTVCTL